MTFVFRRSPEKIFENLSFLRSPEKNFEVFLGGTLALVSLVLGFEHFCSWPREGLSSEGLSLASDFFFVSLALASSLVSSIPPLIVRFHNLSFYCCRQARKP